MKKFFIILFYIFICKYAFSINIFETEFINVQFKSNNISNDKIELINKIKKKNIKKIFNQTLDYKSYEQVNKYLSEDLINTFVKNIIINDENIINNKYFANIKVNFDKKKIIDFYRNNNINYVEYLPDKFLLIIYEENDLHKNLFTKKNNFYLYYNKHLKLNKKFRIPNLDINDRYILKFKHIKSKDIKKINYFSSKYNIDNVLVVHAKSKKNKTVYRLLLLSNDQIYEKTLDFDEYKLDKFFSILENESINIWKKLNHIQNNKLNVLNCNIKYFNMSELKAIRNKLRNVSNIKNLDIKLISYKNIQYDIYYYGNLKIFVNILKYNNLKINTNENFCSIMLK